MSNKNYILNLIWYVCTLYTGGNDNQNLFKCLWFEYLSFSMRICDNNINHLRKFQRETHSLNIVQDWIIVFVFLDCRDIDIYMKEGHVVGVSREPHAWQDPAQIWGPDLSTLN